ncbi:MAG: class I SAM-dependent methyltransferase [Fimbriimonadales bacterium]
MSSFTHVAAHYDDLMAGVPYPMWISYLELLWSKLEIKPRDVLEVCCGTGTLCQYLTKKGHSMTGIDLSQQMIDIAIRKADEDDLDIRFSCQDAASFELPWTFDAAFSFFDSINYITDPEKCRAAIAQTARHLKPGAPFVFDLNTAYAFEQKLFDQSDHSKNRKVRYTWLSRYEPATRVCTVEMDFWTDQGAFNEVHVQRAHSPNEITDWMTAAGFEGIAFYDAYTLDRPRGKSDRIHVVGVLGAS